MAKNSHLLSTALLRRGFLIHKERGGIYLSNNAVLYDTQKQKGSIVNIISDVHFLDTMLASIAADSLVESGNPELPYRLTASDRELSAEQLGILFAPRRIQKEMEPYPRTWTNFKHHTLGIKVPVYALEPHVALLVKALNAVGCATVSACEGHAGENGLIVALHGSAHAAWADYLLNDARQSGMALPNLTVQGTNLCCVHYQQEAIGSDLDEPQKWLDETRQQAIALGMHVYQHRMGLRQERVHWIDAVDQKEPFAFSAKRNTAPNLRAP